MLKFLADWDGSIPELPVHNWWFFLVILILLVFFIWVVARLTTSMNDDIDPAEIDRQMLTAVSELRSQGELTTEEYRSIKGQLVDRLSDLSPDSDDSVGKGRQQEQNAGGQSSTVETSDNTNTVSGDDVEDTTDSNEQPDS